MPNSNNIPNNSDSNVVDIKNPQFLTDGKFDIDKFNNEFVNTANSQKAKALAEDEIHIQKLNETSNQKTSLVNLTLFDLFVGIKNTWFDILDDMLLQNFQPNVLFRGNRLFFVGLTLILLGILMYFYTFLVGGDVDSDE